MDPGLYECIDLKDLMDKGCFKTHTNLQERRKNTLELKSYCNVKSLSHDNLSI